MRLLIWFFLMVLLACGSPQAGDEQAPKPGLAAGASTETMNMVRTGAMVLADERFARLRGHHVGLIVNQTAVVDTTHLIDLVETAPGIDLVAVFGPEHGVRGTAGAGATVQGGRDTRTGVPLYSLYGDTRKPTPKMLEGIDVLVFDIQDVGARFYTYISTMGLAMQAAAEAGITFTVLDRPNPLGGDYVSGFSMEPANESFVGMYPVPVAHGMTVGELARMIKGEGWIDGLDDLDLQVVAMDGWRRDMRWEDTGLDWIPPSPNIPNPETALVYAGAAFFEATSASEGRGTHRPFIQLGAPWADGVALARILNARELPGVHFEPVAFTPQSIPGVARQPKYEGTEIQGIRHVITDADAYRPVETGIHVLQAFYQLAPPGERAQLIARPEWLAKLSGTDRLQEMLQAEARPEIIIAAWHEDVARFEEERKPYLLY